MENQPEKTHILVPVTQSIEKGYPYASDSSREAFEWILEHIVHSNFARFNLQFIHVQNPRAPNREYVGALDLLEHFRDGCHQIGVSAISSINPGLDPKIVICNEVKRFNPDLLVIGSGSKVESFRRFLNPYKSSVSEYCSKHAECHVIIVKNRAEDRR